MKIIRHREMIEKPNGGHYFEPAVGECVVCKRHVTLSGFTNTCDCGADYNSSGQHLAPREQWGDDTGESVADILAIDAPGFDPWDDR